MTEALKPCPFCGGEAEFLIGSAMFFDVVITCKQCSMSGPIFDDSPHKGDEAIEHNRAEAITAWNTRAPVWQDIETAPRDGTEVDLWVIGSDGQAYRICDCRWSEVQKRWFDPAGDYGDGAYISDTQIPTHYMVIDPPTSEAV